MPKNSFPTFPNNPTPAQLVDKFFKKENNHSFIESFDLKVNNVFLFSDTFKLERVYNTQSAFGDADGAHFRWGDTYEVDIGGEEGIVTVSRTLWMAYDKDNDQFIGRYNDEGPQGIFFYFKAAAPELEAFYIDFEKLVFEPQEENGFGEGTVTLENPVYRSVNPYVYNLTFVANTFGLGAAAPIEPPYLLPISPSNPIALAEGNGIILTHKGHYVTADNDEYAIYIGYGVPNTQFVNGEFNSNIEDHPPQWFILEIDRITGERYSYFVQGSIFGNGDPDSFKWSGLPFTEEGFNAAGWNLSLIA